MTYSQLVALEIYRQRKAVDMLYLDKETAIGVADKNNINLQGYEITGQSLLTRDVQGNWKFAHKSIMEFFIAKEAMGNFGFLKEVNFTGMDVARQFCSEIMPEFVFIKGGAFPMGSRESETDRGMNETLHQVKVCDFYMAKHTITVSQFERFIIETNYKTDADKDGGSFMWNGKKWNKKPGVNWCCDVNGEKQKNTRHPVIHVSWNDAYEYCQWLSKKCDDSFRLPTEAEWEYACRADTITPFNTGNNLTTDQANYNGNYPYKNNPKGKFLGKTTPVDSYPPNAWGLCDMHGNVWEWCSDWYGEKYYDECKAKGIVENPEGPETGDDRIARGGSWYGDAGWCRCAFRYWRVPGDRDAYLGFRLSRGQ
jgi:formylglycine-generating enzyme required for sulfatase activity